MGDLLMLPDGPLANDLRNAGQSASPSNSYLWPASVRELSARRGSLGGLES